MVEASSQRPHVADIRLRRPGAAWLGPSKVTDTVVMLCKVVTSTVAASVAAEGRK